MYLIPFLHQTTTSACLRRSAVCCILFHFYIKPQHYLSRLCSKKGCILFHFYIKPQPDQIQQLMYEVVSYSISTSNHNILSENTSWRRWYLIPFLQQTTTVHKLVFLICGCILFHFYIKPQHISIQFVKTCGCILFHFYIKPQPFVFEFRDTLVVSYSISTSNHNLYNLHFSRRAVVSYSISTSNHNFWSGATTVSTLYLIPFLHQTTTFRGNRCVFNKLYLIPFLHQTTTPFGRNTPK